MGSTSYEACHHRRSCKNENPLCSDSDCPVNKGESLDDYVNGDKEEKPVKHEETNEVQPRQGRVPESQRPKSPPRFPPMVEPDPNKKMPWEK